MQHGKLMATLPKGLDPDTVTLEKAVELLAAKAAKGSKGAKKKTKAKKPAKKAAAKKTPAKKAAAKKPCSPAAPANE